MDSIGTILKSERENRGLSLDEVHDATRITVQNLTAIEDDRFDFFPNRVYARAFLRDYANFLGLDSGGLLERYEQEWNATPQVTEPGPRSGGSAWRVVGWLVFVLVIAGALAAAGYFGWRCYERQHRLAETAVSPADRPSKEGATLPPVERVAPPKPKPPTVPAKPTPPLTPEILVLEVTATREVWVGITSDGRTVFQNAIPPGQPRKFEAKSTLRIRVGMAGAVELKLNGEPQPPLGTLKEVGDKTFTLPAPPPGQ